MRVEQVGDEAEAAWDAFVASAPGSSIYHRYRWRRVVREVFGRRTVYLAAREGDAVVGVLPIVRLRSALFGDFLVSLPYFNYGGVLGATTDIERELLANAIALATGMGVSHLELRHRKPEAGALPARTDKVSMLLELPPDPAVLLKRLDTKVRSQIKRPLKAGATCVQGRDELLDEFYAVFAENMRDLGTPVYPRNFFRAILQAFPDETRLFVVRLDGRPAAAGFVIADGATLEIPWASSLRRANAVGVNMLLYWSVLEFACRQGHTTFDFGRCTVGGGAFRFKRQWGASPVQLHWHYWMREAGELPRLNHSNPKFELAVAAWRRLPLAVANRLGPLLVRNLP